MTLTVKKQIELKLFIDFPTSFLELEGIASALQSFETAIYCIALRRWPATVELVWQSSELLLRHLYKQESKNWSSIEAMNTHLKNGNVSSDLSNAAHQLRKSRNSFMHNGFSPKDDYLSIKTFFEAGVPYFANLLKTAFNQDLYEYTGTGTTGKWFWDVYKNTRKLITDSDTNEKNANNRTWLFVLSCHKIITVSGRFEGALQPYNHYEYLLAKNYQDINHDINTEIIKNYIHNEFHSDPYDTVWLQADCEICGSELLGTCDWDDDDRYITLTQFGCAKCSYVFKNMKEIKILIGERAFQGKKQLTVSDMEFVKDRMFF